MAEERLEEIERQRPRGREKEQWELSTFGGKRQKIEDKRRMRNRIAKQTLSKPQIGRNCQEIQRKSQTSTLSLCSWPHCRCTLHSRMQRCRVTAYRQIY